MNVFFLKIGLKSPRQNKFFTDFDPPLFTPFKRLFAPTSQSPMSKLFLFSLGKTNVKIWSSRLAEFFWYRWYYPHWSRDALSPVCGIFFFMLWGKPINLTHNCIGGAPPPRPPLHIVGKIKKLSLIEPSTKVCQPVPKLSNEALLKSFFFVSQFLILSRGLPRRRSPAKIAARWRHRLPIKNLTLNYIS